MLTFKIIISWGKTVDCKILALKMTFAIQVDADCGILCDRDWWNTATATSLQANLDAGTDVMAQDRWGTSRLFLASQTGNPNLINALLTAGADVGVCDVNYRTPLH